MKFYGQYDTPVDRFMFERYFPDRAITGFFIECGAFDGTTLSSCKFFEETMGWQGLNIEPAPENYADLVLNRPKSRNLNTALSDKVGEMVFNRVVYPDMGKETGLYGSLEPSPFLMDQVAQGLCTLEELKVPTLDWKTLIERERVSHVTLLVLDVEGHELSVLAGMAGSAVLPEIICIEFGHLEFEHIRHELDKLGYVYDIHSFGNAFFIRKDVVSLYAFRAAFRSTEAADIKSAPSSEAPVDSSSVRAEYLAALLAQLKDQLSQAGNESQRLKVREIELLGSIEAMHNSKGWRALSMVRRIIRRPWRSATHSNATSSEGAHTITAAGSVISDDTARVMNDFEEQARLVAERFASRNRADLEAALVALHESGEADHRLWKALSDHYWNNGPADFALLPSKFYLEIESDANLSFRAGELHGIRMDDEASRVRYFEDVVRCDAQGADDHLIVGLALTRLGRTEEAFKAFEAGLLVSPGHDGLWSAFVEAAVAARSTDDFVRCLATHRADTTTATNVITNRNAEETVLFIKELSSFGREMLAEQVAFTIARNITRQKISDALVALRRYVIGSAELNDFDFRDRICGHVIDEWSSNSGDEYIRAVFTVKLIRAFSYPFVFEFPIDDREWIRNFCDECRQLTREAVELDDPLSDLGFLIPWQKIYTRAAPDLYGEAASAIHDLCAAVWPRLVWTAPHVSGAVGDQGRKIKIGFTCFDIMPMISGLMGKLDDKRFETVFLRAKLDQAGGEVARDWIARAGRTVDLPDDSVYAIQEAIAAEELDIIVGAPSAPPHIYPMFARLAPLQMTIIEPNWCDRFPNLDYYISWGAAEPANYRDFYRNAVAFTRHPPYWLDVPRRSDDPEETAESVLANAPYHKRVYLCPTNPAKLHASFDEVVRRVLLRDPEGIVVFLRMDNPVGYCVQRRMKAFVSEHGERLIFLPLLKQAEAHALLQAVDCVLDAYPLGGMSSSFVSVAVGTPTVSLPKEMPFGKWMGSIYDYIGVEGLNASSPDDYAEIAFRLASDREWREAKAAEIRSKGHRLIESEEAAAEFENFILKAWERHTNGLPPTDWVIDGWAEPRSLPQ